MNSCEHYRKDSDGLLSRSELRAVLASFFQELCRRVIQEDAATLSAALISALDPQKSGYIVKDGSPCTNMPMVYVLLEYIPLYYVCMSIVGV